MIILSSGNQGIGQAGDFTQIIGGGGHWSTPTSYVNGSSCIEWLWERVEASANDWLISWKRLLNGHRLCT
ncbi:hypothetical protein JTE90_015625 [Oedothorax gibbosus]|uniref:Uncharacterized protein n=1 Tax=Oedothorax gibbosus TaxID=931172 RepID=A0AAV6UWS5_9ARAC|nr:hypothetical protein JTE90_015625 [Oedothorax gibbosus]